MLRDHKALSKTLCLILALVLVLLAGCDYILTSSDGSVLITGNETTHVVDLRVAGNVSGGAGGNHTASDIEVSRIAGSTYDDVQDYIDVYGSRGLISGGEITDNGDGTVDVAAGTAWLRISDTALASLPFVDFGAEANLALTDQQVNYIYVDYNAGTPLILATINFATIANDTRALLAITFRDGNEIHITYLDGLGTDIASKINLHLFQRFGISRTNGLIIGSSARYITLTPGIIWGGLKDSSSAGFGTDPGGGADTFTGWHTPDSGGSWNKELAQSEVDNLRYNDITSGLVTLTANRYVVGWVWVDFDGENLHYQYGQGDYTLNQAVAAQPPAVTPPLITGYCFLVGKVIMQKSAATMEAQSHFDLSFSGTSPSDHAALSNVTPDQHHTEDHAARHTDGSDDIQDATSGQKGLATATQITKLDGIEAGADVTDAANVDAAGAVMESDFNAKGDLLSASADDTPLILSAGANGTVLTADPGEASGLKWANATGGGGDVATDSIWDAAGDIAVGTGADTAAVLSAGNELELLSMGATTPEWGNFEAFAHLMWHARWLQIPTAAAWTSSVTGTGATFMRPTRLFMYHLTTAGTARLSTAINGQSLVNLARQNWDKKLYLMFTLVANNSDAGTGRWIQYLEGNSAGNLAAQGVGVFLDNLTLYGESYGSARGAITLNTTLTDNYQYDIVIIIDPDVPNIKWYVNGTLQNTQTTAANIPSGIGTQSQLMSVRIANAGASPPPATYVQLINCKIWQAL